MQIKAMFVLEKVTPGALRYQEVASDGTPLKINDGAKVGTLYVRKSALDGDHPQRVQMTIDTVD